MAARLKPAAATTVCIKRTVDAPCVPLVICLAALERWRGNRAPGKSSFFFRGVATQVRARDHPEAVVSVQAAIDLRHHHE